MVLSDKCFKEMGQLWIFNAYQYHALDTNMHNKQLCCELSGAQSQGADVCAVSLKKLNL